MTSSEACDLFRKGMSNRLFKMIRGPLWSIAPVYVPFRVYRVEMASRQSTASFFAIDAVNGSLDLYWFAELPTSADVVMVSTRNHPTVRLEEPRSSQLVHDKVRRLRFQTCAHRSSRLAIQVHGNPLHVHVPYWVGFFGSGSRASVRVIDALRRRLEGAKVRELIERWLIG